MSNIVVEDKILDFLDGHLESHDEEELLHRLAVSPEKRGLLREHMKLREVVSGASKTEQLAVPANVTASLYRKLAYNGYAGGSLGSAVSVTRPMAIASPAMMVKSAAPVASYSGYRLSSLLSFAVLSFFVGVGFTSIIDTEKPQLIKDQLAATHAVSGNSLAPTARTLVNPTGKKVQPRPYSSWQAVSFEQRRIIEAEPLMLYAGVSSAGLEASVPTSAAEANAIPSSASFDGSFFEDSEVELVERVEFGDLSFDTRATALSVGAAGAHVAVQPEQIDMPVPAVIPTIESEEEAPFVTTGENGLVSSIDPIYPSLRSDIGSDAPSPLEFTFGEHAKTPASTYISVRSGGGRLPGSDLNFSGSLSELRLSYQIGELLVVKASFGELAPWENVAQSEGYNGSGLTVIGVKPTLNFRYVLGAEAGLKLTPFAIPLEISAGGLLDESGMFYPRGSVLTSISLSRDFSILMGVEAVIYMFDVDASVASQMSYYQGKNPAVRDGLPKRSLSGFIGPTIEAAWHF